MTSLIYLLSALIIGLQFADYYTTWVVLKRGGTELNPIVRGFFKVFGIQLGLIVAKFWAGGVVATGAYLGWFESFIGLVTLGILTAFYLVVVVNNYFEVQK